jgi:hypothetical protein
MSPNAIPSNTAWNPIAITSMTAEVLLTVSTASFSSETPLFASAISSSDTLAVCSTFCASYGFWALSAPIAVSFPLAAVPSAISTSPLPPLFPFYPIP